MKKVFVLSFLLFTAACLKYNTDNRRVSTRSNEAEVIIPELNVSNQILNCQESDLCYLEEIIDPEYTVLSDVYRINSIIHADSILLNSDNIDLAPAINFEILNLNHTQIKEVRYSYKKNDLLGNILSQSQYYSLYSQDNNYEIPIHSSTMGISILISVPYQIHSIEVEITNQDNISFFKTIEFFLQSNISNPTKIKRTEDLVNSSYYKFEAESRYLIDSIEIENTLPIDISTIANIEIQNETLAFLSEKTSKQGSSFTASTFEYPFDIYNWFQDFDQSYSMSNAKATFVLGLSSNGFEELEIPITVENIDNNYYIVSDFIKLTANQKITANIYATYEKNNELIGDHGTKQLYSGISLCSNPVDCSCYYLPDRLTDFSNAAAVSYYYSTYNIYKLLMREQIFPNCMDLPTFINQKLFYSDFSQKIISLAGRHHRTQSEYTLISWYAGFEDSEPAGKTVYTPQIIESLDGFTDYTQVSPSLNYSGFIPIN